MIAVGDTIDTRGRRAHVVALIAAAIGNVPGRDQLAAERVIALAPTTRVTAELIDMLERLLAIATPRCGVRLGPSAGLHPACATLHAEQLAAATGATPMDRTIHTRGRR